LIEESNEERMQGSKTTREDMVNNLVPLHVRDNCAGVLIPLNKCRRQNFFLPWNCEEERHSYEICMYKEYEKRRELKKQGVN
jgi:hypothetical protein